VDTNFEIGTETSLLLISLIAFVRGISGTEITSGIRTLVSSAAESAGNIVDELGQRCDWIVQWIDQNIWYVAAAAAAVLIIAVLWCYWRHYGRFNSRRTASPAHNDKTDNAAGCFEPPDNSDC